LSKEEKREGNVEATINQGVSQLDFVADLSQ